MDDRPRDASPPAARRGVFLEDVTWLEAERLLGPERVVVIPLGAAAKEHGPHLLLRNDHTIAEYLKRRVADAADVAIAPTVAYHYFPAFVEYPGSVTLRLETARDLMVDIARSYARHGARRIYVLNTGVSTNKALAPAAEILAAEGVLFRYTKLLDVLGPVEKSVSKQEGGTHADEIETSMMLYIDPAHVDMSKATKDFHADRGPLTRNADNDAGTYSRTGIWGDPTLATRDKGKLVVEALVAGILADVESLRTAPLP